MFGRRYRRSVVTPITPIPDEPKTPNLVANPFSHTGGVVRLLFALYVGRRLVVLRKFDRSRRRRRSTPTASTT